ncbi:hypothetical protein GUJ93_ZPchr0003g18321 [Zizania palustris]|uniref:NADP-dependent oxidoreductase domain-containing protein n=1 Tax=Zizania palustris TaxID=103762 RepID=A0A8J5VJX4_ZIZPA|nr:hypothetical protein GUJ93_ZPchr0003g18321 [Zizania palustris]
MLRSAAAAAARSPAAAALRRFLHGGGREDTESVAYRMSMLRAPPVVRREGLLRNSCSFIGRLVAPVRPFDGSSGELCRAYTSLYVSSSFSSSDFRMLLQFKGKLANVSLMHLKQNDLVYVSGILKSYHKVDASGEQYVFYKILVTELNYVLDQNQRPENDKSSSDKASDEILTEKRYIDRLRLWQVFFASPYEWWDNRHSKPYVRCPDFKHKDTREKLWLCPDDPPWVRRQLELLDQEMAQNGHRDEEIRWAVPLSCSIRLHRTRVPRTFSMQQMALSAFATNPSSYGNTLSGLCARQSQRCHQRRIGSQIRAQAQGQLQYRKLGDSDLLISEVTLGTMTFGEQNTEKEAQDILSYSFDQGVNILDTAEIYPVPTKKETQGRTDIYIGSWMQSKPRDKIILATKVAGYSERTTYLRDNAKGVRVDAANIKESVEKSLSRLSTDYIDLLQIHWPDRYVALFGEFSYNPTKWRPSVPFEDQLRAFQELIDEGKVMSFYGHVCFFV